MAINAATFVPFSVTFKNNTAGYVLQGAFGITGAANLVIEAAAVR